ncbi:hypothetical protein PV11_09242 [Exophiala sideris]|uniref:Uncharacterized protein n=1 Tax=Exophiala sideris TaxID=1016849 RepID=A0A0D1YR90_9EURO|nr:hypothetical protein PV11_09242 [Exophiala sideris]
MTSNDDVKLPKQQQQQPQQQDNSVNNTLTHFRFPWEAYSPSPRVESSTRDGYFDTPKPISTTQQPATTDTPQTSPHGPWTPGFHFPTKRGSDAKDFAVQPDDSIQRHGSTDAPFIGPSHSPKRRRSSISGIPIPPDAVLSNEKRPLPLRRRSNSLPTASVPSLNPAPGRPEVRKVIFTPSPFRRDTLFPTDSIPKPLATFKGERLVEHPEEEFEELRRPSTRESVLSLERWHNLKTRASQKARSRPAQLLFEYSVYTFLLCFIYFLAVGRPLWKGAVWYMWYALKYVYTIEGGCAVFLGVAFFYSVGALLVHYEPDPAPVSPDELASQIEKASSTALIIPCYKSAAAIEATLQAALKTFPAENIYVVANGNSPTPLDDTEDVIRPYKVNHIWVPIGSKIVAQFVGTYAAYKFQYVLMIDDDCLLPANFPIVSDRIQPGTKHGSIKCVGYTIKATGPNGSKGNAVQQLQDLEYKMAGMQRQFAGSWGSATFAHGAIALWERDFILKCFRHHPGFKISEDWYFGLVCRNLGGRVVMCSSVLVETEVPSGLFVGSGSRGGFGEMTVYKQRFYRWNFLFLFRMWHNLEHILFKWDLGVYSIGSKVYTFQMLYETILYVTGPVLLPIAFVIKPRFMGMMTGIVMAMYFIIVNIFNEITLRRKNEMVSRKIVLFYYPPYKFVLRMMNVVSVYYSAFKYAQYFATRHPSIIEDTQAVELVIESKKRAKSVAPPMPDRRPSFFRRLSLGRRKSSAVAHHDEGEKMPSRPKTAPVKDMSVTEQGVQHPVDGIDRRRSGVGPFSRRPSTAPAQRKSVVDQAVQQPRADIDRRTSGIGPLSRRTSTVPENRSSVTDQAVQHLVDSTDRRTSGIGPFSRRTSTASGKRMSVAEQAVQHPTDGFERRTSGVSLFSKRTWSASGKRMSVAEQAVQQPRPSTDSERQHRDAKEVL